MEIKRRLKEEIKQLSKEIREAKVSLKLVQKELSSLQKTDFPYDSGASKFYQEYALNRIIEKNRIKISRLIEKFRFKHILRSILNGKSIEQIEPGLSSGKYFGVPRKEVYSKVGFILKSLGLTGGRYDL